MGRINTKSILISQSTSGSKKMNCYILLNEIFLLVVNIIFLVAGTLFNTVVVLSIWKSSQLRKKLCYFMILILSCTDLLVVIVIHPLHIFCCIIWYFKGASVLHNYSNLVEFIGGILITSSINVLFTMTLERYIGLTYPLFHKTRLTRRRLVSFFVVGEIVCFSFELSNFALEMHLMFNIYSVLFLALLISLVILINGKMFVIAKSRTKNSLPWKFKPYYTCALAVTCFLFCCCPIATYHGLAITETLKRRSDVATAFFLWSSLVVTMNSIINSVIFFWMNNALKSEGNKLLQRALKFFKS